MKELELDGISLVLFDEKGSVRVASEAGNILLSNQTIDNVAALLENNFQIVNGFYQSKPVPPVKDTFGPADITFISIAIVLHYLNVYNSWRSMYKKQENKDLRFNNKDFDHPFTNDIIFSFLKKKYPHDWEQKSAILLEKGLDELRAYYKRREDYYNK